MATKEELLAQADALRAELDKLNHMIEALNRGTWERAPHGNPYYYVGFCNTDNASYNFDHHVVKQLGKYTAVIITKDYGVEEDIYNWENGNYFYSAMDAERSWRARSTEAKLRRLADKLNAEAGGLDWDNEEQPKYCLWYDSTTIIKQRKEYCKKYADMRAIHCVNPEFLPEAVTEVGRANLLVYLGRTSDEIS